MKVKYSEWLLEESGRECGVCTFLTVRSVAMHIVYGVNNVSAYLSSPFQLRWLDWMKSPDLGVK